ncbi:MAG: hypothetical protein Q8Q65_00010 [bacterium]|nr:hypothetical protein [bacterium]
MIIDDVSKLLDEKLGSIQEDLKELSKKVSNSATKDDLKELSDKAATKDDLKKMENRLVKRFDTMDKRLDQDLAETMQRVKHIENHIDIPPFTPISPN